MRIAIVGSRSIEINDIKSFLENTEIEEIISGGAKGVDSCAKRYAEENAIKYTEILLDYKKYGRAAPIVRNRVMLEISDTVFVFWDGISKGTESVIRYCRKLKKPHRIFCFSKNSETVL